MRSICYEPPKEKFDLATGAAVKEAVAAVKGCLAKEVGGKRLGIQQAAYKVLCGRLFQPSFEAAAVKHWSSLVPNEWIGGGEVADFCKQLKQSGSHTAMCGIKTLLAAWTTQGRMHGAGPSFTDALHRAGMG